MVDVLFCVWEIIARSNKASLSGAASPAPVRAIEIEKYHDLDLWTKNKDPDVQLDAPLADFHEALMSWVRRRGEEPQITHYSQAPDHFELPALPPAGKDPAEMEGEETLRKDPMYEDPWVYRQRRAVLRRVHRHFLKVFLILLPSLPSPYS